MWSLLILLMCLIPVEPQAQALQAGAKPDYGPRLEHALENAAGDFIFIAPGVPHEVFNLSASKPVVAIVARSDASEWENIVPFQRPAAGA